MKEIELTKGKVAIVDDSDYDNLSKFNWRYICPDSRCNYAFSSTKINEKLAHIYMHRIILGTPKGMMVDHINGNGLDNRRENLRIVTAKQNSWNKNKRKNASSQYYGVCRHVESNGTITWKAQVCKKFIGRFENERHAAMARDIWAKEMCGEYAKLNFNPI